MMNKRKEERDVSERAAMCGGSGNEGGVERRVRVERRARVVRRRERGLEKKGGEGGREEDDEEG